MIICGRRNCKRQAAEGSAFCGEHRPTIARSDMLAHNERKVWMRAVEEPIGCWTQSDIFQDPKNEPIDYWSAYPSKPLSVDAIRKAVSSIKKACEPTDWSKFIELFGTPRLLSPSFEVPGRGLQDELDDLDRADEDLERRVARLEDIVEKGVGQRYCTTHREHPLMRNEAGDWTPCDLCERGCKSMEQLATEASEMLPDVIECIKCKKPAKVSYKHHDEFGLLGQYICSGPTCQAITMKRARGVPEKLQKLSISLPAPRGDVMLLKKCSFFHEESVWSVNGHVRLCEHGDGAVRPHFPNVDPKDTIFGRVYKKPILGSELVEIVIEVPY